MSMCGYTQAQTSSDPVSILKEKLLACSLSRVLRGISEKKVDPGKWPKPTLPHSSSILDIADLEFDISVQTITSA